MRGEPLDGVLAKIGRAVEHEQNLWRIEERVQAQCNDAITRERDRTTGDYVFRIDQVPSIPAEYALILGDAIHNLRSSLDHLAVDLVIAEGGGFNESTGFPILVIRSTPSKHGPTPPQLNPHVSMPVRWALDEVQPYRGRDPSARWLQILHRLDITDKHRRILTSVVQHGSIGPVTLSSTPRWTLIDSKKGPLENGDVIARAVPASEAVPDHYPAATIDIVVSEGEARPDLYLMGGATLCMNIRIYIEQQVIPRLRPFL